MNIFLNLFINTVQAAGENTVIGRMKSVAGDGGYNITKNDPIAYAGTLVQFFLGLLGVIFVALIIKAGSDWMLAGGESAKLDKAKEQMWRAVIGLLIILGAAAIQAYVFARI